MTKQMDSENMFIKMDKNILDFGTKIYNMEQEEKNQKMVLFMKGNFKKEKSMVTENIVGKTDQFTEVNGKTIQ